MLAGNHAKELTERRLKLFLALFFLALAIPTVVLIWQGYRQLKWESFHLHRGVAEEFVARIDRELIGMVAAADRHSFADYRFLIVTGDPSANFLQRSPLSRFPVSDTLPGTLGYFQVGSNGEFTTPVLPAPESDRMSLGINDEEFAQRQQLAAEIHRVLADNKLVRARVDSSITGSASSDADVLPAQEDKESNDPSAVSLATPSIRLESGPTGTSVDESVADGAMARGESRDTPADNADSGVDDTVVVEERLRRLAPAAEFSAETYSQDIFDQLNQFPELQETSVAQDAEKDLDEATGAEANRSLRANAIRKVSDIKLDADLQKKSETAEREDFRIASELGGRMAESSRPRQKRTEQSALPDSIAPAAPEPAEDSALPPNALRVSTFESEVDPFEFSLLNSGHFVLFRNVWRENERFIQGLLVDQKTFVASTLSNAFYGSALSEMSNLILAYEDDVIHTHTGSDAYGFASGSANLDGSLLYRSRLAAPLNGLDLIFTVKHLPAGPGATVLGWVTIVLGAVFLGGYLVMYRLGISQIQLARQQQDFVSAVSHELKTPLTSIRMYGEMLKEGWAEDSKRQEYYEYIHDESERLTRMISNVLQLANITHNEPQLDLKAISVGELLSNIQSKISSQVERAGFALEFRRDDNAGNQAINIDADCFAQIIINLVDNAIKFSRNADTKAIVIGSSVNQSGSIEFYVRDHGPGIATNQMKKIFRLFFRTESELTRETVGTGIGLAIVHQLTTAMNGTVDVVNKEPGAEFRISFPAAT